MARPKKEQVELEIREQMGWREYYASGMKRGVSQAPSKEMLITHVDEQTGVPTYQGLKVLHVVSDGRGDDKDQYYVEVLYDADYVQNYLYSLFTQMGFITNNTINKLLWDNWFNPEKGKIQEYGATEGSRKQEAEDLAKAKDMAAMIEGTSVEDWLSIIKQKRAAAIAAQATGESKPENDGNGSAKGKKPATAKA